MKNRRKIIAGILVAAMALAGVLVGTVSADDEANGANPRDTVMARVAELLGVDQTALENAFTQALQEQRTQRQEEMQAARDARMQELIDQGVLTQEQVDAWDEWLASRPDNSEAMQEWMASRPDMGDAFPFAEGRGGMRPGGPMMRGGGMAGFGGLGCPTGSEA